VGTLALHLTRQEIAEYLGLKLETVSRSFSKLRKL
jgi:CRP-like cAMP-binding protein